MEEFVVEFVDLRQAISVPEKTTLWEAIQKLKISKDNSCVDIESCGSCKIVLQEGMVDYPLEPESSPRGNVVLACLAKVLSSCKVAFLEEYRSRSPKRSALENLPLSEWGLHAMSLFGLQRISLEGPDPFDVLENGLLRTLDHPGILAVECDYGLWKKLQNSKEVHVSYACLPGRAKVLHIKDHSFEIQLFALVLGSTFAEIVLWNPLSPKILYHTTQSYSKVHPPYLGDLLHQAQRQIPIEGLLGGVVAGSPSRMQLFLGLARPPYSTRPTEIEKLSISGFPNAIVYPMQQGLAGNSSGLNAALSHLKTHSSYAILVDFSEHWVLACSPEQNWATLGASTFPERSEKTQRFFSEEEWLQMILQIYQAEKSPSPRMWLNPAYVPKEQSDSAEARMRYAYHRLQEIIGESLFSVEVVYGVLQSWNWLWQVVLSFSQKLPKNYVLWMTGRQFPAFWESMKQSKMIDPSTQWLPSPVLRGVIPALLNRNKFVEVETLSMEYFTPEEASRIQL